MKKYLVEGTLFLIGIAFVSVVLVFAPISCSKESDNGSGSKADIDNADPDPNADRPRPENEQDTELEAQCQQDDDCPPGYYCGAYAQCLQDCTSDEDCGQGRFCNGYGRCSALREADTDAETQECPNGLDEECPTGFICSAERICVEGCKSRADCHIGEDCIDSSCQSVQTDGDQEAQCATDEDCPPGNNCIGGVCVPETPDIDIDTMERDEEFTCTPCNSNEECMPGRFCGNDGCCHFECMQDSDCDEGEVCIEEIGKCEMAGGDEFELPEGEYCNSDEECPAGTYCKEHRCDFDCVLDSDCAEGMICNSRGRCALPSDEDGAEYEREVIQCATDEECPAGMFCTPIGECGFECIDDSNCGVGQYCDPRGRCRTIGGDEESNICREDDDCPPGLYCSLDRVCTFDCRVSDDCNEGQYCTPRGRCVYPSDATEEDTEVNYCTTDDDCPAGTYCAGATEDSEGLCVKECETAEDCGGAGWICTERGQCLQASDGDQENEPPEGYCGPWPPLDISCQGEYDCRVIVSTNNCECAAVGPAETRADFVSYTMQGNECIPDPNVCDNTPCQNFMPVCVDGVCQLIPPSDGDEELPEGYCEYDAQCPSGYYCDMQAHRCRQDCITNEDCGDPEQYYCNDIGKCLPLNPDGDTETSECNECSQFEEDTQLQCSTDDQCPIGSFCLLGWCTTLCYTNDDCPEGMYCNTERGRCERQKK